MSGYEALDDASGRPLTGRRTLGIAAACFSVIFAVNGYMAYSAISTFTGETEPRPYEHGLAYQKDIEAAKAQAALGWSVSGHVARDDSGAAAIEIRMQELLWSAGKGAWRHRAPRIAGQCEVRHSAALAETAPGLYAGRVAVRPGPWDFEIEATQGGARVFKSENRIALR